MRKKIFIFLGISFAAILLLFALLFKKGVEIGTDLTSTAIQKSQNWDDYLARFAFGIYSTMQAMIWSAYQDDRTTALKEHGEMHIYLTDRGAFDFYRMPLEYPYQLTCIDNLEDAAITKWELNESSQAYIVWNIIKYQKIGSYIFGETMDDSDHDEIKKWFSFNCSNGTAKEFHSYLELEKFIRSTGHTQGIRFETVQKNWDLFWQLK